MTDRVQVLVVGAGPTGLTLACDLRRRGVRHRVVNAAEHGFEGSRAKGVQPRSLEVFDDLGVLPGLRARATTYPPLGLHAGPLTLPWVMYRRHRPTEDVPHPNTLLVPQYATDAILRQRLGELGGTVEDGTRLVSFEQDADGVTATVEGPRGTERVRSRFLVGADGGGSTVRAGAGIGFAGTTDESDRMIVADVTVSGLSRDRWHVWPRGKGRFMALCPLPGGDTFQLMLKLRPGEDADLDREAVDRSVRTFAAGVRVREVHWASVWRPNTRLAERYRSGHVFVAGDAAHVHPPTGAQGLNTGVQDAYNLGWKLGQVLAGAPEALLDTYEAERQPVAARVLGLSSEIYAGMSSRPLAATRRGDEERQLTLTYRGGPLAPAQGGGSAKSGGAVGDRAADAPYTDVHGRAGRLFDVFRGPHFTLIALGAAAVEGLRKIDWPDAGAPLVTVAIPSPTPALTRGYGIRGSAQILVRPDGHIASIAHRDWNAVLRDGAQAMLPAPR
ncbi:FAD-dependent monooxygenase [Herbidospora sp. NBRC 101105]|uniref:FAD-dependent monooxygenase n=1 Tax=Herbidospora sp. NBRC 101105 TaxID=3032195 RepID=UPI0024A285D6|nr:FAD-dependent monooxygenase [Herbidospora sp. NBRC 101105]GLX97166.1 hypothetical protein Hesp01_51160 [Herbidospora sp. NBRC 101105]